MKRISLLLMSLCLLVSLGAKAQNQDELIPIPNGSFENWSNGNGYSVTILVLPLEIYGSYTYPTNWNFPSFPIDETFSYMGVNVNLNTNLPLMKVSKESNGVVDGNHAVNLQSFKISDLINPTVYAIIQSQLDSSIANAVFPTVLSTGELDIMEFLPLIYSLSGGMSDISQLLEMLDELDMNTFIHGGIPLNGSYPARLTGSYKYSSPNGGDNGGVLMVGSRYNTTTHKRQVVGAGFSMGMGEASNFTPFEVDYFPLALLNPSSPYMEADSLVIFLFSSASVNAQQGSSLIVDNLQLWAGEAPIIDGISQLNDNQLSIYPNPAHGQCVVRFTNELPQSVKLYTIEGKLIQEVIPSSETLQLSLPSKGIFILCCETESGVLTRKIVNR